MSKSKTKKKNRTWSRRQSGRYFGWKVPGQLLRVFVSHNWEAQHGYYVAIASQLRRSTMFNMIDLSVSKEVALRRKSKDVYAIVRRRIMRADLFVLVHDPAESFSEWVRKEIHVAMENSVPIIEATTQENLNPLEKRFWRNLAVLRLEQNELDSVLLFTLLLDHQRQNPLRRSSQSLFGGHRRKVSLDGRLTFRHYKRPRSDPDDDWPPTIN